MGLKRFTRYTNDCNVYLKSKRIGQRVMKGITTFLEARLTEVKCSSNAWMYRAKESSWILISIITKSIFAFA